MVGRYTVEPEERLGGTFGLQELLGSLSDVHHHVWAPLGGTQEGIHVFFRVGKVHQPLSCRRPA